MGHPLLRSRRGVAAFFCASLLAGLFLVQHGLASPARAESTDESRKVGDEIGAAGSWRLEWIGATNSEYIGGMKLTVSDDGEVEGEIKWRLTKTPREDLKDRIDHSGVEYVRGRFTAANGLIVMEGYRKDDPDGVLGLDRYRLLVSPDGQTLAGLTADNGSWKGRCWGFR